MVEITGYELPKAIKDAPVCKCREGKRKTAIVKRKATVIYDDKTHKSNEVIALPFCSECGTYISKEPVTAEQYQKWQTERAQKRKEREKEK